MRENLPKELDFVREAENTTRAVRDFEGVRTSLYIPEVIASTKRVLIMEFIRGGRVDDLQYLAENSIDRNKVALELSRIFSRMVFVNGWFHAVSVCVDKRIMLTYFAGPPPRKFINSTSTSPFTITV